MCPYKQVSRVKHRETHAGFKSVSRNSPEKTCELEKCPTGGGLGRRRQRAGTNTSPQPSQPLDHGAEQSRPSAASHMDSTIGRWGAGVSVSSVRDVWVPNIKGEREFAVPIIASCSKPGAGRIKAQSHLPANPRQECFLPGIVFFSYLQARCTAPTLTLRTGSHTPTLAGLDAPPSPDCPSTLTSKGLSQCLLSCSDAGALGQRKGLVSTLEAWGCVPHLLSPSEHPN